MLRSATKQTSRVLRRSRTIPRVAQSVRQHSPDDTEGAESVLSKIAIISCVFSIGNTIAYVADSPLNSAAKRSDEEKETSYRTRNTWMMYDQWSAMARCREAVLNKRYNSNHSFSLHNLFGMTNKSNIDQIKGAPVSVAAVIRFFLWWKIYDDDKDINSAHLKEQLGSQFATFHSILTEIRDEEAKSWHQADSDNLNEVIGFLDKMSKMEMNK